MAVLESKACRPYATVLKHYRTPRERCQLPSWALSWLLFINWIDDSVRVMLNHKLP